jgi:hypothetical protein
VVEPARHRFPARAVLTLAVLVVFGSLLVSAMVHSMLVSGQARIDDLGGQIRAERKALEDDRLRLAEASSPERLAAEAERIGLVFPSARLIRPAPARTPGDRADLQDETDPQDRPTRRRDRPAG